MIEKIDYSEFISGINGGTIEQIRFLIEGYSHYNDCLIRKKTDKLDNGNEVVLICVDLVTDLSESIGFYRSFNEKYKLFNLGRKGKFTLKDLWERVKIIELVFSKK